MQYSPLTSCPRFDDKMTFGPFCALLIQRLFVYMMSFKTSSEEGCMRRIALPATCWSVLITWMSHMPSVYSIALNGKFRSHDPSTIYCSLHLSCHYQVVYFLTFEDHSCCHSILFTFQDHQWYCANKIGSAGEV